MHWKYPQHPPHKMWVAGENAHHPTPTADIKSQRVLTEQQKLMNWNYWERNLRLINVVRTITDCKLWWLYIT
jgi:hypothetical protein